MEVGDINKRRVAGIIEDKVACYLNKMGFEILERNFRVGKSPETDIIAIRNETLHFIEIKARSGTEYGYPEESITKDKLNKMRISCELFLQRNGKYYNSEISFDIAGVFFKMKDDEEMEILKINITQGVYL